MIDWTVTYWIDNNLVSFSSKEYDWDSIPNKNVLWVEITDGKYVHRLLGMDNYWVSGDTYGMFNNVGDIAEIEKQLRLENNHQEIQYTGYQAVYFKWNDDSQYRVNFIPTNIRYIEGVMIPDDKAIELGLI